MSIAIAVLAAGQSSRMGKNYHKLLALFDGLPLIRRSVLSALESDGIRTIVVLGHRADDLHRHLSDLKIDILVNEDFASGLSSSLRMALAHIPADATGMMVLLPDMPGIGASDLIHLQRVFEDARGKAIVRATAQGQPGHPVILPRSLFSNIAALSGDIGARQLIASSGLPVIDVELGHAAMLDVDTPAAVITAGGKLVQLDRQGIDDET